MPTTQQLPSLFPPFLASCWCGSISFTHYSHSHPHAQIPGSYIQCTSCGTVIQSVRLTSLDILNFYKTGFYHTKFKEKQGQPKYSDRFKHDVEIGKKRLAEYSLPVGSSILDVGCGNGGFLFAAKSAGYPAVGQDIWDKAGVWGGDVYHETLESVAFPTDSFDYVVCHDVLEHVPNISLFCKEIHRILKPTGTFILDYPHFFTENGTHHWKEIEHIWMLPEPTLLSFLGQNFTITRSYSHTEKSSSETPLAKLVVFCQPKKEKRVKILVPPGIGDSYWSVIKLESFCERNGLGIPDVYVAGAGERNRSADFLRKFPFLHFSAYAKEFALRDPIFHEAYMENGRQLFRNVHGFDFFLAANGILRYGKNLESDYLPEYKTNWFPKMHYSLQEREQTENYRKQFGDYVIVYLPEHGMYQTWIRELGKGRIEEYVRVFQDRGTPPILVGAKWDKNILRLDVSRGCVNLIGKTSFSQLFSLLLGAKSVFGFPSGLTILSAVLRKPTLLFWSDYFCQEMWTNCIPPVKNYRALSTKNHLLPAQFLAELEHIESIWPA